MNREEKINQSLKEHYEYLQNQGYEIVGVFLHGSQNYNNDIYDEEYQSDVDTKAIVLPRFDDFVIGKSPISKTLVLPNNEQIDVKDIRVMFDILLKCNVNFLEILVTDFKIINPKYLNIFNKILDNEELLTFVDKKLLLNCIIGMSKQKFDALKHPFPKVIDKINKYVYDPKQLTHIIRLNSFFKRILNGESFKQALDESKNREYLIKVKKGFYTLEQAEELAVKFNSETECLITKAVSENDYKFNENISNIYLDVKYQILKQWFKEEIEKNN